jgi:D-alanyl-D-alanine carboxypeptidase
MVTDKLKNYIIQSLKIGKSIKSICQTLLDSGWQETDILEAFRVIGIPLAPTKIREKTMPKFDLRHERKAGRQLVYFVLSFVIIILGGTTLYLWQDRLDLSKTNTKKVQEFYAHIARSQVSFTDAGEIVFPDEQKFITKRIQHINNRDNFIEINLRNMKLTLYEDGIAREEIKVLTKGKDGSWWETPTGNYKVLGKTINHFSSIGKVWMPYSIQFYGNYFIHGWPYYNDGTPVPPSYSGGCIRLSNEDAKTVFNFAKKEMPILILEDEDEPHFGVLEARADNAVLPVISAKSFLISNLASGETILEKEGYKKLPIASLTKLMTGVVAHELVYLGRSIKVIPQMLANVSQVFHPVEGKYYTGMDLLYPLLMQSSNASANILASFIGKEIFIRNMNAKAASLAMDDTEFADPSGISSQNISTAHDISKLLRHIYYKRRFLFDISKGKTFKNVGLIKIGETINIGNLKNFNEFVKQPDLIGMKNGETTAAGQTMASVWEIHTPSGKVPIAIIVLGSSDRMRDTKALLDWIKGNFVVF